MKIYILNIFCAISQLINALTGGNHNEMLSAKAYRKDIKWLIRLINIIFLDSNHCKKAFEYERDYPQLPFSEYLNNFY
jgi:hypothetical protein